MFIVFDTEDDSKELLEAGRSGFDKRVTQIAAMTREGKRYYNKGDTKDFKRWLLQQPEKYIYAHNIQYDLGNLFSTELDSLDCTLVGGRMIKAAWKGKEFRDSFNIYAMSVKAMGEAFGLEKLTTTNMATDTDYVWRDVEIVRSGIEYAWAFVESMGVKVLPTTAGGICFKIWKDCLNGENCHDSLELSREAYYGGRVELFKSHSDTTRVAYTDINSLYPSVLQNEFPGVLEDYGTELAPEGIARVTIDMPETELAILPYRGNDGRIFYPYGKFTGSWAMPEIKEALASGGKILKVHQCNGCKETMRPYAEAMQKFYAARLLSKTGAEKEFFKRMMNAFYGRLGTTGVIGRTVWRNERNAKDGTVFGEKVLVSYSMPLSEETNWSHACYVTAYGRLELLKYLRLIGAEKLIYCDTDSAIFDCPSGRLPYAVGKELGQMKLEAWETSCQTWAPKMYRVGNRWKAKGVPQRLARNFIETGMAHYDLPFKYREAVAFYDRANAKQLSVWRTIEKRNITVYDRKKLVENRYFPCKIIAPLLD